MSQSDTIVRPHPGPATVPRGEATSPSQIFPHEFHPGGAQCYGRILVAPGVGKCRILPLYAALYRAKSCKFHGLDTWPKTGSQEVDSRQPHQEIRQYLIITIHSMNRIVKL